MKRTILFASDAFGLPATERLLRDHLIDLIAVVTQPARPAGRKNVLTPTPAATWAAARDIPTFAWDRLAPHIEELRVLQPDFFLVASYGLLIPQSVLDLVPGQCLNIHASLLPEYRGASPITQVLLDGREETGVTIMQVVAKLDAGPIIDVYRLPISQTDTAATLRRGLEQLAAEHISRTLNAYWDGTLLPREQVVSLATYAGKVSRDDGRAQWKSAKQEERKVRAYDPWPGLWTTINGQRLKILSAAIRRGTPTASLGTIEQLDPIHWGIACADGWLIPERIQWEGKKPSDAETLLQHHANLIGRRCD